MVILCQTTSNRRGTESILQANKISLRMMQYIKRILTELKLYCSSQYGKDCRIVVVILAIEDKVSFSYFQLPFFKKILYF
ncbi:hypothetical protein ABEB36_004567 [Hypothenemus hampei]|uniref:Uncharacterized protein n=1 Tax=Hypothenemus hampei TaxID=57062 RepID=A0ABD1F432_HYPHA